MTTYQSRLRANAHLDEGQEGQNCIQNLHTTAEVLIMDTDVFMINNFTERHLWTNLRELRCKVGKRALILGGREVAISRQVRHDNMSIFLGRPTMSTLESANNYDPE